MICNRDIMMTGLQSIDFKLGSNAVNLAYEFSKKNRVLYINHPLDRLTIWKDRKKPEVQQRLEIIQGKSPELIKIKDNLWTLYPETILESISQIPSKFIFNVLNKINNRRFAKSIKQGIQKLDFENIIWFNDSDFYRVFYLQDYLDIAQYIYYSRDNMVATRYFRLHGERMEGAMMTKANAVVANSTYLQNAASTYNPCSFYVGQGCDVSAFDIKKILHTPEDIALIKKPIIGYIGALVSLRLDIDLIYFIASQRPDWNIVLVGPEDDSFKQSQLHLLDNIKFLGSKDQSDLPDYLACFDVAFNPQAINPITIGNYPRKIDEYLAMGKPVVATYTEAMQVFDGYVYLAKTGPEYIELIEFAMLENSASLQQKREAFAKGHTWEANADEIYRVMEKVMIQENLDKTERHVNKTKD